MLRKWSLGLTLLLLFAAVATAQPVVYPGGAVNAASFIPYGLPNSGIAQGSLFSVFGTGMGPAAEADASYPLPADGHLAGTTIAVTVNGTVVAAIVLKSQASQVAAVLPSNTPAGNGTLTLTYNGQTSAPINVQVVANNFGTFARNQAGSGPAVADDFGGTPPRNSLSSPAHPGQVITLWGTGLGPVPDDGLTSGPGAEQVSANVVVTVGGKNAAIQYKGRAPGFVGLDQINFVIPSGVSGCYVPISVTSGGMVGNSTTMSVAPDANTRTCTDPTGLSADDLGRLSQTGSVKQGFVNLSRNSIKLTLPSTTSVKAIDIPTESTTDTGSADFSKWTFDNFLNSRGVSGYPAIGSCYVLTFKSGQTPTDPANATAVGLDAGPVINVTHSVNGKKQLTPVQNSKGAYYAQLGGGIAGLPGSTPLFLEQGMVTVDNGGGGADVGAFSVQMNLPQAMTWTNEDQISTVQRSQGVQVTWSGGDPNSLVIIYGYSMQSSPEVGAYFFCTAKVSDGQFTVPSAVTSVLPQSTVDQGVPEGLLAVGSYTTPVKFNASGLDLGFLIDTTISSKNVGYN